MIIYTMLSMKCGKCRGCDTGNGGCFYQVKRMTTDPGCPTHATTSRPRRCAAGRVAYRLAIGDDDWGYSCLTPARERGRNFDSGYLIGDGSDEAAIAWLTRGKR